MNPHRKQNSGFTLAELLVTTVLIGVVMLGISSIDVALHQLERGTSRNSLMAMRTNALMFHIREHARLTTGDANNPGAICMPENPVGSGECSNATHIWIRREDPNVAPALQTANYNDDVWVMYHLSGTSFFFCDRVTAGNNDPTPITACPGGATEENLGSLTGIEVSLERDRATRNFSINITLRNRSDPLRPIDPFNNPENVLTATTYPLLSSF